MVATTGFITRHPVVVFYALLFALSWGGILAIVGGPRRIPGTVEDVERLMVPVLLALFAGPSLAGVLMTGRVGGTAGLRALLARGLRWRVSGRWYAIAVLGAPIVVTVVLVVLSMFSTTFVPGIVRSDAKVSLVLFGAGWGLVGGGLLEEVGETGFAVHHLRHRYTALTTALIVGVLWGAWHVLVAMWTGASFSGGRWPSYLVGILFFYFGALPAYRVLMVWVYDRTESLLVAMLMHASLSASTLILQPPLTGEPFVVWNVAIATALWIVVIAAVPAIGWRPPRPRPV